MDGCLYSLFAVLLLVLGIVAYRRLAGRLQGLQDKLDAFELELSWHRRRLEGLGQEGGDVEALPEPEEKLPEPAAPPTPAAAPSVVEEEPLPEPPSVVSAPAPAAAARREEPRAPAPARRRSLEELLGTQVFLKAGVTIIVLGMVFFLGYALKYMGPAGRVVVGYLVGFGMLAGGWMAERRDLYRALGRALLAGAWGILYFVTFAMHFVPAARVVESPLAAALALLAAGGAAVVFSLRYRHEWTTAASFLLIFLSLFIAAAQLDAAFNLLATTVVAAGLSLLAWRMAWDRLLAVGIPATWLVASVWLLPHVASLAARGEAEFNLVVFLDLVVTWALLLGPILWPRSAERVRETWHGGAYLADLFGLALALWYVHTTAPGADGAVTFAFGAAYLGAAVHLARRGRRPLHLLSATVGLSLVGLAAPFHYGAAHRWLPVFWFLEVELVLAAGVLLRERYFRALAYLGFAFVVFDLLFRTGVIAPELRLPFLAAGVVLSLGNVYLLRTRWRPVLATGEIRAAPWLFSAAASVLLVVLLWNEIPEQWVAPALAGAGWLWIAVAVRFGLRDFLWEGGCLTACSLVALAATNLGLEGKVLALPARPVTVLPAIVCFYLAQQILRRRAGRAATEASVLPWVRPRDLRFAAGLYLSLMVAVTAMLLLHELHRSWVVASWAALALALLAPWLRGGDVHWRFAGTAMAVASAVRGIGFNLVLDGEVLERRAHLAALPVAVVLLLTGYLVIRVRELSRPESPGGVAAVGGRLAWLFSLLGLVSGFLAVEVSGTALTVWLSVEGLAVVTLGFLTRERVARLTGLGLLSFCILKLCFYDLWGLGGLARIFSFIVLGVVLVAVSYVYTRFKDRLKELL